MKAFTYGDAGSKKIAEAEIPENLKSKAEEYRTELIEKIAETNEELMNKYFEEGSLSDSDIETGLKAAIIGRSLSPVFAISATKAVGVNNFLDFMASKGKVGGQHKFPRVLKGKMLQDWNMFLKKELVS